MPHKFNIVITEDPDVGGCAMVCRNAGRRKVRKGLDPAFYGDLAAFRAAVATGTVDVSKGCRNMAEYHQSFGRAHV